MTFTPTVLKNNQPYFCVMIATQIEKEERELDRTAKIILIGVVSSVLVAVGSIIGFLLMAYQL